MKFNELCDLNATKLIEKCQPIEEKFGQYIIKVQLISDGNVIDEREHQISGDEAAWYKYKNINKEFMSEYV